MYLIGTGLEKEDVNLKALKALKKCKEIYIDTYTSPLPFSLKSYKDFLLKVLRKKIKVIEAKRALLEEKSHILIDKAKDKNIAILVYGDPLIATTHMALIKEAKEKNVKYEIIHNCSIVNVISNLGLSIYKFGKIASMPKWEDGYKPVSFYEIIKENKKINAHTLLLIDISLDFKDAIEQLKEVDKEKIIDSIYVCSRLGTREEKVIKLDLKNDIKKLTKKLKIKKPFCFIIPSALSFYENFEV
jgi:diphthine synthase